MLELIAGIIIGIGVLGVGIARLLVSVSLALAVSVLLLARRRLLALLTARLAVRMEVRQMRVCMGRGQRRGVHHTVQVRVDGSLRSERRR